MTTNIISDNNIVQVIEETNGIVVNTTQNIVRVTEEPFLINVEVIGIQGPAGDSSIILTGDVTGSGTGTIVTTIKESVNLTGTPTTTTQSSNNGTNAIATCEYVDNLIKDLPNASSVLSTEDNFVVEQAGTAKLLQAQDVLGQVFLSGPILSPTQVEIDLVIEFADQNYINSQMIIPSATEDNAGVMSASDKQSLDNIEFLLANTFIPLVDQAILTPDLSTGHNFKVTITGNRTLGILANLQAGYEGQNGTINVFQDSVGGRSLSYDWAYQFPLDTPPVISTAGFSLTPLYYQVNYFIDAGALISIGSPAIVTASNNGFVNGQRIRFTTTGALPTGISLNTTYYASIIDTNTFYICASLSDVTNNIFINTTGTQSGSHTVTSVSITLSAVEIGTITSVSIESVNGFAGTSSGGNNPVLTIQTTVEGLVQGDGTTLSAATNIDNIPIGANTPSTGTFTTLTGNIDCGTF